MKSMVISLVIKKNKKKDARSSPFPLLPDYALIAVGGDRQSKYL